MATNCFTPLRGRRMRATTLDTCGRVVYGVCSQVVTRGFVKVEMKANKEAGTEVKVKNAGDEICALQPGCDQLNWYDVTITFCQVDPDLVLMLNPNFTKLLDLNGDVNGWAETYTLQCDKGIALELWTDTVGSNVCDNPNAVGAFGYILLPWITGGSIGDLTVENAAVSFVLTGRTRKNPKWGAGPYNVQLTGTAPGTPGPLITPVGPDEPRRIMVVTVPPPVDKCGCQPLSNPAGPTITAVEDTADATRMTVKVTPPGTGGPFTIDWGDGTATTTLPTGGSSHLYVKAGAKNISVWPTSDPTKVTVVTRTVPFS